MVMVNVSKRILDELDISESKLEDILFSIGFEVEEVTADEIKIDVTHDRYDAIHYYGLKRILQAYLGKKPKSISVEKEAFGEVLVDSSVSQVRPYTCCCVFSNLNLTDDSIKEIINVQEKLHQTLGRDRKKAAIGIYPLEKISFPIKYLAKEPKEILFKPLGSIDVMNGDEILNNHDTGIKYAHLLAGKNKYPIFQDSKDNVLSMPPIINSELTGRVDEDTKAVFVECSGFDLSELSRLLNILCVMFLEIGAKIHPLKIKYDKKEYVFPNFETKDKSVKKENIFKMLGVKLKDDEILNLLKRMQFDVKLNKDDILVTVPFFRNDIWHEVDIIDDIIRAYGLNNLEPRTPMLTTIGNDQKKTRMKNEFEDVLVSLGFNEVSTLVLTNKEVQFNKLSIDETKDYVKLGTAQEKGINMLKNKLFPELLSVVSNNLNASFPLKLFELDFVTYFDKSKETKAKNSLHLSLVYSDNNATATYLKQVIENLSKRFNLNFTYAEKDTAFFIPGRGIDILYENNSIGFLGEIHPKVLDNFNIYYPCMILEICLDQFLD